MFLAASKIKDNISPLDYYSMHIEKFKPRNNGDKWIMSGLCPFHADKSPGSFGINRDTGAFKCFSCRAKGGDLISFHSKKYGLDFKGALKDLGGICTVDRKPFSVTETRSTAKRDNSGQIKNILKSCLSIDHSKSEPARLYLKNRGLDKILRDLPDDFLFHPHLPFYGEGGKKTYFPTLVAIMKDCAGATVTLHRTYITLDGKKAPIPTVRKLLPGRAAGAIHLYPADEKIGICEGIETALAVRLMTGLNVWAATSTSLLVDISVPTNTTKVIIYGDNDKSKAGQQAAITAAENLTAMGKAVKIVMPAGSPILSKSIDWLDVYNQ